MAKILLVDDANLVLQIETALFKRTGVKIVTASTGSEALRMVLSEKPDLILLDLVLPDITGDRICEQVKNNPLTAHTPIIMVTTCGKPEDIERCWRAGCDDYETKPINQAKLLRKAMQLISLPSRRSFRRLVRLEMELAAGGVAFYGASVDVSPDGMLVDSNQVLKAGDTMQVRFVLPGGNEISCRARVVREDFGSLGKNRYGIEFTELPPAQAQLLREFVEFARKPSA